MTADDPAPTGRVLTVENATDTQLGFVLCRKGPDDWLHLHIVDPDEVESIHGEPVWTFDAPDMRTFMANHVVDAQPWRDADDE